MATDTDGVLELFRQHRDFNNRFIYFLLAVAASGVAFAIQKSENAALEWPLIPLGLAVVSFGLSFYFGISTLRKVGAALGGNYSLLQLKVGAHPGQPPAGEATEAAVKGTYRAIEESLNDAQKFSYRQIRLLFTGGIFFVVWHVLDLYLKSYCP